MLKPGYFSRVRWPGKCVLACYDARFPAQDAVGARALPKARPASIRLAIANKICNFTAFIQGFIVRVFFDLFCRVH